MNRRDFKRPDWPSLLLAIAALILLGLVLYASTQLPA